jgi:DNA-binding NtrC family response regulator
MAASHALERLGGSSPAMARVRRQVEVAAASSGTVLIAGPPGIGRQHVARTIHFARKGPPGPLTPVACAALPAEVIVSTLQGALYRRAQAEGETFATVLLTDIHLLPAQIYRDIAGWLEARPAGMRFIATAPEPLDALVCRSDFPRQLAELLSTIVIEIPPLIARREDIPLIAQMLLEDFNSLGGKQFRGFTAEALDRLAAHDWPGQIDELAAIVRESAKTAEGYEISAVELPKRLCLAADATRHTKKHPEPIDLEKHLAAVESDAIRHALSDAKGNKARAARLLGLTRPRLYRRMVELGLLEREESASDTP